MTPPTSSPPIDRAFAATGPRLEKVEAAADRPLPTRASTARKGVLALVDQALVSGARFATTILIGRYCGQQALGHYSLGFSLLLIATCIQESLITAPYTVLHVKRRGEAWHQYNGSVLLHVVLLSLLTAIGFGGTWLVARHRGDPGLSAVVACLAVATPFALLREFARRLEFAQLRLATSVLVDGAVAVLQVGLLSWLAWRQQLTAGTAVLSIGVSSAVAGLMWLGTVRKTFHPDLAQAWRDLVDGWRMGRWMFMAQLTGLIHLQGMLWLIAGVLSPEQTGLFAACNQIVLFINPFALGLNNFISPMTVRVAADRGLTAARRMVRLSMSLMFGVVFAFTLVMTFFSQSMLSAILPNAAHAASSGWLIFLLGVNLSFNAAHMVNDGGLWAVENPRPIFYSAVIAVLVTGAFSIFTVVQFGLLGAAVALLVGRIVAVTFQSVVFFWWLEPADVSGTQGVDR